MLDDLRLTLTEAGITLPSLQLHYSTWITSGVYCPNGLIELGACNLETARALTAALRRDRS